MSTHQRYVDGELEPGSTLALRVLDDAELQGPQAPATEPVRVAIVDCETTGLDEEHDEVIELAIALRTVDRRTGMRDGPIEARSWLREPSRPIGTEAQAVSGITPEMVRGRSIGPEAAQMLGKADYVIAHNASFDRPLIERALGRTDSRWLCSMRELDWNDHPVLGRSLVALCASYGAAFVPHRAGADVQALGWLLAQSAPGQDRAMAKLLAHADDPTLIFGFVTPGFPGESVVKGMKSAGLRWNPTGKIWWGTHSAATPPDLKAVLRRWARRCTNEWHCPGTVMHYGSLPRSRRYRPGIPAFSKRGQVRDIAQWTIQEDCVTGDPKTDT